MRALPSGQHRRAADMMPTRTPRKQKYRQTPALTGVYADLPPGRRRYADNLLLMM